MKLTVLQESALNIAIDLAVSMGNEPLAAPLREILAAQPDHSGDGGEKTARSGLLALMLDAEEGRASDAHLGAMFRVLVDDDSDGLRRIAAQAAPAPQGGDERARFEDSCRSGVSEREWIAITKRDGEGYASETIDDMWDGWKRRAALAQKAVPVAPQAIQRIMARLAGILDEDQFAEIEQIATSAGIKPPAPIASAEENKT